MTPTTPTPTPTTSAITSGTAVTSSAFTRIVAKSTLGQVRDIRYNAPGGTTRGYLYIAVDGENVVDVDSQLVLTDQIVYTKKGQPCTLADVKAGDWMKYNHTISSASLPSTDMGCTRINILSD